MMKNKLIKIVKNFPFLDDIFSAYYCSIDPETPKHVKISIIGALLYLVMPVDIIPDFIAVIGFTDDITVLATVIALVRSHIKESHKEKAKILLDEIFKDSEVPIE